MWDDCGLLADCDSGPCYSPFLPGILTQLEITAQGSCRRVSVSSENIRVWEIWLIWCLGEIYKFKCLDFFCLSSDFTNLFLSSKLFLSQSLFS